MESRIEINPSYRLICDYCIPFFLSLHPTHSGNPMHKLSCMNVTLDGKLATVSVSVRFHHTAHNSPALHISHIPPHNDHYNINTSSGRTRRTVKKKITHANLSQIKSGKGGVEKGKVHRMNDGSGCTVGALRCTDRN